MNWIYYTRALVVGVSMKVASKRGDSKFSMKGTPTIVSPDRAMPFPVGHCPDQDIPLPACSLPLVLQTHLLQRVLIAGLYLVTCLGKWTSDVNNLRFSRDTLNNLPGLVAFSLEHHFPIPQNHAGFLITADINQGPRCR